MFKKAVIPILILTIASCGPTPSEKVLLDNATKTMEENRICPPETDPKTFFTNISGYDISSRTYAKNGLRPSFILMHEYGDDPIVTEMAYLHEAYHYCSLQKEEDFQNREITSSKYGKLLISKGFSLVFKNENTLNEQVDIFEEAFAYLKSIQLHSDPNAASEKLLMTNPSMFKVATLMNLLTYSNPDIHLLSFSDFIFTLTGRELNSNDLDFLLSEFEQVRDELKTPGDSHRDIREHFGN